MKSIEQLLELSKNPFYKMTPEEQEALNAFLSKKQEKESKKSQKQSSNSSDSNTPVRVRNVVQKTVPDVKDAPEGSENA